MSSIPAMHDAIGEDKGSQILSRELGQSQQLEVQCEYLIMRNEHDQCRVNVKNGLNQRTVQRSMITPSSHVYLISFCDEIRYQQKIINNNSNVHGATINNLAVVLTCEIPSVRSIRIFFFWP